MQTDHDPSDDATATSPGAPPGVPPSLATLGGRWAHLQLLAEIGHGSFGRVYRAWDPNLAREVAVKIIEFPGLDPALADSLLHEGRMLASVRHPNVVTIHDAQPFEGRVGLCMELVRGRSLSEIVRQNGPLGPDEAATIGVNLCRALAAVHGAGLIHGDLKPSNVMREAGGRIVLMDFGAGHETVTAGDRRRSGTTGTPIAMAPEVLNGEPASHASDIYSLGTVLYFLVTGHYPVEGRTVSEIIVAHNIGNRLPLVDRRADLPTGFVRVVERALAPRPELRHPSAGAMMSELSVILAPGSDPAESPAARALSVPVPREWPEPSPDHRTPRTVRRTATPRTLHRRLPARSANRWPWWVATAIAAALVVWGLGFLMSMGFNVTLGRTERFVRESPLLWAELGLRSLVAPAFVTVLLVVGGSIAASVWRLLAPLLGLHHVTAAAARMLDRLAARTRQDAHAVRGFLLVLLQLAATTGLMWAFRDVIVAFTTSVSDGDAATLAPLYAGRGDATIDYRLAFMTAVVVFAAAWYAWWRGARRRPAGSVDRTPLVAGLGLSVLLLLFLELPYRIINHSRFEVVRVDGASCFVLGEDAGTLLLHCPTARTPRNRLMNAADARVQRLGSTERLFATPLAD